MKKIGLFFVVIIAFFMAPFSVLADKTESNDNSNSALNGEENNNTEEENKKVKIYFFRGDGCPHCAHAKEFFNSLQEEYGHLYEIVDYEVYNSSENSELMDRVAEVRGDNDDRGIPYIIIGNKSWAGYTSSFNSEIIETIKKEYEKPVSDRYDIMELLTDEKNTQKDYGSDAMILILILIVTVGVVAGVMYARKKTA